jgi:hypothetical protein
MAGHRVNRSRTGGLMALAAFLAIALSICIRSTETPRTTTAS